MSNPDALTNERDDAINYRTLSEPQKRHLREMVSEQGETLYWHPANQGERSCAAKLKRLGLLDGNALTSTDAYWLTETGLKLARGLRSNNERDAAGGRDD